MSKLVDMTGQRFGRLVVRLKRGWTVERSAGYLLDDGGE